jgi:hypothetical protein
LQFMRLIEGSLAGPFLAGILTMIPAAAFIRQRPARLLAGTD